MLVRPIRYILQAGNKGRLKFVVSIFLATPVEQFSLKACHAKVACFNPRKPGYHTLVLKKSTNSGSSNKSGVYTVTAKPTGASSVALGPDPRGSLGPVKPAAPSLPYQFT